MTGQQRSMDRGPASWQDQRCRKEDRYIRERDFHDQCYAECGRQATAKFQSANQAKRAFAQRLSGTGLALDYGCGRGSTTSRLARLGYEAIGIDLSDEAIRQARGREPDAEFRVMNAEALEFEDDSFDLVCGKAILHHLDLDAAYAEVARVLKPEGRAVFLEPLGHNPLINLYRRATPSLRTEDEQPFRIEDIGKARTHFGHVSATFWDLFTLAGVPFRSAPGFERLQRALASLDALALQRTRLRKFAWKVLIELRNPQTGDSNGQD